MKKFLVGLILFLLVGSTAFVAAKQGVLNPVLPSKKDLRKGRSKAKKIGKKLVKKAKR